jgi:hypothetical protein
MYVRQARQFLRTAIEGFDERRYGFASVVDLLRAAGKENVFRIERDRQGAVRVFPGTNLVPKASAPMDGLPVSIDEDVDVEVPAEQIAAPAVSIDHGVVEGTIDSELDSESQLNFIAPTSGDEDEHGGDEDEIEEEGPQLGNEINPRPGRARKTTKSAAPSRARAPRPRGGAAKTTSRPRGGGGARKSPKPRS